MRDRERGRVNSERRGREREIEIDREREKVVDDLCEVSRGTQSHCTPMPRCAPLRGELGRISASTQPVCSRYFSLTMKREKIGYTRPANTQAGQKVRPDYY